jgi:hypothetical protein
VLKSGWRTPSNQDKYFTYTTQVEEAVIIVGKTCYQVVSSSSRGHKFRCYSSYKTFRFKAVLIMVCCAFTTMSRLSFSEMLL